MSTGKIMHLLPDLAMLLIHAGEQRRQFIIYVIFKGLVQVEIVNRLHDLP